jgi:septal ring factor EnvC (AmiA/AmiB activator)
MALAVMPRVAAVAVLVLANLHDTVRAVDQAVSPVAKVIDLLKGLAQDVKDEGTREAATYDKFACFCKDSTKSKSSEITRGTDKIDELSASIEAKSAEKKEKQETISERTGKQETMSAELDEENARCLKEEQAYDEKSAEFSKAMAGIREALKSLTNSKRGAAASSLLDLHGPARENLELAEALELAQSSGKRDPGAFLQQGSNVDPEDAGYKWHSSNVEALLKSVGERYSKKKDEIDATWQRSDLACKQTKDTLKNDIKNNKDAISKLDEKAEGLGKDIAKAKEDLVSEQTALADAEAYLQDLTNQCEARSNDFDQRSATRKGEVEAISSALEILEGTVKGADEAANKRALLLSAGTPVMAKAHVAFASTEITADDTDSTEIATEMTVFENTNGADEQAKSDEPSDLGDVTAWLHGGAPSFVQIEAVPLEKRRNEQVLAFVQQEGRRLGSTTLLSLAAHAGGDPFGKVKGLIQQLIERLLQESADEATKKGFCDEQLGKTKQARDYAYEEVRKLNAEIRVLEVKKEELDTESDELKDRIANSDTELDKAKTLREDEHNDNVEALAKAKEGLEAVNEAYSILKGFYSKAGSSALLQASPVDEDSPDAPEGDYKGNQGAAQGILGLLQVVISDFERTLKKTSENEAKGASEFEETKQNFEAEVASYTTKRGLNMQDSESTAATIRRKTKDHKFEMDAVDANVKTLEELKPTCIDHGRMSFKDRTEKREQEVAALKEALIKLAP